MEKNLIIDIEKHCPMAERIFSPADYYSPEIPLNQMLPLQIIPGPEYCKMQYGITPKLLWEELDDEYNYLIIIWPVHSFNDDGYITNTQERRMFFEDIYRKLENKKINKIIYIDGGDRAIIKRGMDWLDSEGYRCDCIFKREYRLGYVSDYDQRVFPFPFTVFGKPNPALIFYESKEIYPECLTINECFWAGSPIFANAYPDEFCDRLSFLQQIGSHLSIKSNLSHENFLKEISKHKFFLHLNGTGHLCKRFFEGLSTGSLMMMQRTDLVFPFENDDYFSEATLFSTPEEFISKLNKLKFDNALYYECLENQKKLLKKYFNYDWIRDYVNRNIKNTQL